MYIALISDPHTGTEKDFPYGIDLRRNFLEVLDAISSQQPDLILIGGDLCFKDPQINTYRWQKSKLDQLKIPYLIIAGNHDDTDELQSVFSHLPEPKDGELFYQKEIAHRSFIFLDTSRGEMSSRQKTWLKSKILEGGSQQVVIMHHPPTLMHVPFMDENHALKDREEVMDILNLSKYPLDIYCGHYHVEKTVYTNKLRIHLTPSCYFQIDQYQKGFAVDHHQIAYRMIYFPPDRDWAETQIHYLSGNKVEGPIHEDHYERK